MSIATILAAFERSGSVTTDSRKVGPGDVFFALKGDRFDGNVYAAQTLEAGAALAVVDDPEVVVAGDDRYVLVEDGLKALQDSAEAYRKTLTYPILGITGSNGKTTTKELLLSVLSTQLKVQATKGNLNNHIGVPLTLFSLPKDLDLAIVEMGANKPGDIAELCAIAHPTHGMITNIGRAHLELFGDVEGVQKTKGELFDSLRVSRGVVYVNAADRRVKDMAHGLARVVEYGGDSSANQIVDLTHGLEGMQVSVMLGGDSEVDLNTRLIGEHNAWNILAAATVAWDLGLRGNKIRGGIGRYRPTMNRTQLVRHGEQLILMDAYNANPSSMLATLQGLAEQEYGKVALVLGDMFELGKESLAMHREVLRYARQAMPDASILAFGKDMMSALKEEDLANARGFLDVASAEGEIVSLVEECDFLLIKGSRGMALEKLLDPLGVQL